MGQFTKNVDTLFRVNSCQTQEDSCRYHDIEIIDKTYSNLELNYRLEME